MSALQSHNAALETQLRSQLDIAQGLAELSDVITMVRGRAQSPTRRILVDQTDLRKPPVISDKEEDITCATRRLRSTCRVCFGTCVELCRFQWSRKMLSQQERLRSGVSELDAETSAEIDGQFFTILGDLTDGESFDVVTSAGGG